MNRINWKTGILSLLLLVSFVACNDDDTMNVTPELAIGERTLSFDDVTTQTLKIESNGHWNVQAIKDSAEFLVSPTEGYGNGEIEITLNRTKPEEVYGYLKITYLDGTDEGLQVAKGVKLTASKLDMDVYPRDVTFNAAAGYAQQTLRVYYPGKWTASLSDTSWCELDKTTGENEAYLTLSFKEGKNSRGEEVELVISPEELPRVRYVVKVNEQQGHEYGDYTLINKATEGKGIDIVMIGTFFLEDDLKKGGRFDQACDLFSQYLFALEPYKSYRNYFNVYAVPYPNEYEKDLFANEETYTTSIGAYNGAAGTFSITAAQQKTLYKYAYDNTPVKSDKDGVQEMLVASVICTDKITFGGSTQDNIYKDPNTGIAHAPLPIFVGEIELTKMMARRLLGTGFGGFASYSYTGDNTGSEAYRESFRNMQKNNQARLDVEATDDPEQFINQTWKELYNMGYRNVGIIEGAQGYAHGFWRASGVSAMGYGNLEPADDELFYYNPVQRELILKQIYKLAGLEEEYSLQTFLDYDQNNETNIQTDQEMVEYYDSHRKN